VRFLIDNALSPIVSDRLRQAGHDAVRVRDYGMRDAADDAIFERAKNEIVFSFPPIPASPRSWPAQREPAITDLVPSAP